MYWWERRALYLTEKYGRLHFRVSKNVSTSITSHDVFRVERNITRPIPVGKQLAIFFWRVGRASPGVASVADKFEVSSTAIAITSRVAQVIRERLGHKVHMPKSGAIKKNMMKDVWSRGYPRLHHRRHASTSCRRRI